MSDEKKIEEELEADEDVEAHKKGGTQLKNDDGTDSDDAVEAHMKNRQL